MTTSHRNRLSRWLLVGAVTIFAAACVPPGEEVASEEAALFGSDACKSIDIKITNSYQLNGDPRTILLRKLEFYSASEGRWLTEDIYNNDLFVGESAWWYDEDLAYAENDLITQVKVFFSYEEYDGDWSDTLTQTLNIPDVNCVAGQNFYLTVN